MELVVGDRDPTRTQSPKQPWFVSLQPLSRAGGRAGRDFGDRDSGGTAGAGPSRLHGRVSRPAPERARRRRLAATRTARAGGGEVNLTIYYGR